MKTVFLLLLFFLALGVFAHSYDRKIRMVLSAGIIAIILYLSIS